LPKNKALFVVQVTARVNTFSKQNKIKTKNHSTLLSVGKGFLVPAGTDIQDHGTLSLSPFPVAWDLQRKEGLGYGSDEFSRPKDMKEEWVCVIKWPYGLGSNSKVLGLEDDGSKDPGTRVSQELWFFYRKTKTLKLVQNCF
jgi:hypothetical protein